MNLPAPKWFATAYSVLFGTFLVAGILGAEPVALVAWFLAKIMFFGLAVVVTVVAVLGLAANLIPSAVPKTKQRVLLQITPIPLPLDEHAAFAPLEVYGPGGYSVTLQPAEGGSDHPGRDRYAYDVPMPNSGVVRLTPGNQTTVALDAAVVTEAGGVTVYYARLGKARYGVSRIEQGNAQNIVTRRGETSFPDGQGVFEPPA